MRSRAGREIEVEAEIKIGVRSSKKLMGEPGFGRVVQFRLETGISLGAGSGTALAFIITANIIIISGTGYVCSGVRCKAGQDIGVEAEIVIGTGRFLSGVRRGRSGVYRVVGFRLETRVGIGSDFGTVLAIVVMITIIIIITTINISGSVYMCSGVRVKAGQDIGGEAGLSERCEGGPGFSRVAGFRLGTGVGTESVS